MQSLKRITVELLWTPGHAGWQGNEKADQLIITKKDTEQARYIPEETRTVTIQNNKVATHKACLARWQSRWMNASTGRQYHGYDFPDKATFNRILQLQTGYPILNAHPQKSWSERISSVCACGCPETTELFITVPVI